MDSFSDKSNPLATGGRIHGDFGSCFLTDEFCSLGFSVSFDEEHMYVLYSSVKDKSKQIFD